MTKERLRNYQNIKKERQQIRHQLEELETALYYPKVQQLTGMPSNHVNGVNPQEELAIRHIELQDKYNAKLAELYDEQLAIEEAIETLDGVKRQLLRYRYIDGLPWEEVCIKMSYCWKQIHRLHGAALQELRSAEE